MLQARSLHLAECCCAPTAQAMVRHMTASAAIPHFHFCEEVQASGCLAPRLWLPMVLVAVPGLQTASLGVGWCSAASDRAHLRTPFGCPSCCRWTPCWSCGSGCGPTPRCRLAPSSPSCPSSSRQAERWWAGWLVAIRAESQPSCHRPKGCAPPRIGRLCSSQAGLASLQGGLQRAQPARPSPVLAP